MVEIKIKKNSEIEEKTYLQEVLSKLAEAEEEVLNGKTEDARIALDELRATYNV